MNRSALIPILAVAFIILDVYCYQAIKIAFHDSGATLRKSIYFLYWIFTAITVIIFVVILVVGFERIGSIARNFLISFIFGNFISKLLLGLFLLIDDIQRLIVFVTKKIILITNGQPISTPTDVSRAEFLTQAGIVMATVPFVTMGFGILSGAHDYKIRRQVVKLPNLPSGFDGLKILQISDVHAGSFFNKTAVMGGVEKILNEKADIIFFTGDLVNNEASEMKSYFDVFKKIKAPLGVYSTLGNHDYGDYVGWKSIDDKRNNLSNLIQTHKLMGWDILMNEHRILKQGADQIAIIGVENWGAGKGWPKYGNLKKATEGIHEAPVKLLLSHDPSHWDNQIRPEFPDIDMTFAGHTHGFQFGVEAFGIKWSPSQFIYKQWGGLYQNKNQYLYVNRGFGYLGFPGRVGMPPEITVIELKKV